MKPGLRFATMVAVCLMAQPVLAQAPGQPTALPRMPGTYWVPKPATPTAYVAPNRVHWKLSEILATHVGQASWVQPIVRNQDQDADYISMAPREKTKPQFYADDRMVFIVQSGAIRVMIDGAEPFTATKGFLVNIPARHIYTLETVGETPSLRFEVRQDGAPPLYPAETAPSAYPGRVYIKARGTPGPWVDRETNPARLPPMPGLRRLTRWQEIVPPNPHQPGNPAASS